MPSLSAYLFLIQIRDVFAFPTSDISEDRLKVATQLGADCVLRVISNDPMAVAAQVSLNPITANNCCCIQLNSKIF